MEGVNAIYTCDTGYTLVGRRIRACNSSGNWEATTPTCQSEPVIIMFLLPFRLCSSVSWLFQTIYKVIVHI